MRNQGKRGGGGSDHGDPQTQLAHLDCPDLLVCLFLTNRRPAVRHRPAAAARPPTARQSSNEHSPGPVTVSTSTHNNFFYVLTEQQSMLSNNLQTSRHTNRNSDKKFEL